jgi:hypothetical protein
MGATDSVEFYGIDPARPAIGNGPFDVDALQRRLAAFFHQRNRTDFCHGW